MKLTTEELRVKIMRAKDCFKAVSGKFVKEHDTYQHYKGGIYKVLSISFNTETEDIMVNYQRIDGPDFDEHAEKHIIFSRPLGVWLEPLPADVLKKQQQLGRQIERFAPVVHGSRWVEIQSWPSGVVR